VRIRQRPNRVLVNSFVADQVAADRGGDDIRVLGQKDVILFPRHQQIDDIQVTESCHHFGGESIDRHLPLPICNGRELSQFSILFV